LSYIGDHLSIIVVGEQNVFFLGGKGTQRICFNVQNKIFQKPNRFSPEFFTCLLIRLLWSLKNGLQKLQPIFKNDISIVWSICLQLQRKKRGFSARIISDLAELFQAEEASARLLHLWFQLQFKFR